MGLEKDHDFSDDLLLGPRGCDFLHPLLPDTRQGQELFGLGLNNGEDVLPESLHEHFGEVRANALYHAGAKVFLNTFEG